MKIFVITEADCFEEFTIPIRATVTQQQAEDKVEELKQGLGYFCGKYDIREVDLEN